VENIRKRVNVRKMRTTYHDIHEFDIEYFIAQCEDSVLALSKVARFVSADQILLQVINELVRYLDGLKAESKVYNFEVEKMMPKIMDEITEVKDTKKWKHQKNRRKYGEDKE
jgi:hypothetical protein